MPEICKRVEVGSHGNIPEFRTKWQGIKSRLQTRRSAISVDVEICGPEDVLNDAWDDLVACAKAAAISATIAAIVASPPVALPAFEAIFIPCATAKLGDRFSEIGVGLHVAQRPVTDWTDV